MADERSRREILLQRMAALGNTTVEEVESAMIAAKMYKGEEPTPSTEAELEGAISFIESVRGLAADKKKGRTGGKKHAEKFLRSQERWNKRWPNAPVDNKYDPEEWKQFGPLTRRMAAKGQIPLDVVKRTVRARAFQSGWEADTSDESLIELATAYVLMNSENEESGGEKGMEEFNRFIKSWATRWGLEKPDADSGDNLA